MARRSIRALLGAVAGFVAVMALLAIAGRSPAPASAAGAPAMLSVSPVQAVQGHGVRFDASKSSLPGGIVKYVFDYGDGVEETSTQPIMLHGYAQPGTYFARVILIDAAAQTATSDPVRVDVRDGVAPTVRIDSPHQGQLAHFGHSGLLLRGSARDAGGVARVELAIGLLALPHGGLGVRRGQCVWYDGRRSLVLTPCSQPYFFRVPLRGGAWSFRMDRRARIPTGTYSARVRARDRAGNWSHWFAVPLRTILSFRLAR